MSDRFENSSKSSSARAAPCGHAQDAAHLLDAVLVAGRPRALHQDGQGCAHQAVRVRLRAGGDGDDDEVVLLADPPSALGFEHRRTTVN